MARKEKYPVSPFLEFRPHWKADFFLPEVTGCVASPWDAEPGDEVAAGPAVGTKVDTAAHG